MEKEKQRSKWAREYQDSFTLFVDFLPINMNNLWLRREEDQRATHKGNGAWLGDKELVVKWARFPRTEKHHNVEEDQRGSRLNFSTARGDSKFHSKALLQKNIPYSSEGVETNQQYSLSAIGEAVDGISAEALQNIIITKGFNDFVVRPMGGNKYLLTFSSKESMEDTLKNYAKFLMVWFKTVNQWGEFDVSSQRKTWISCYGLPLHL
ncbi:hypothetical protein Cgig2_015807 [Carnegiea gigantea]|uniref:Uncharacterized protein n=1 Tax=Carnegiea gigantea TaxID=171969 RepID=A0A9Q1QJ14_9CARY|nr:hypothetical protein Cgig2_015807 [Carnegiea gigantea]